jgi:RimJ/RimL family protein N-acetyltransferase
MTKENLDRNALNQPIGFSVSNWKPPPTPVSQTMEGEYCRIEPLNPDLHAAAIYDANARDTEGINWTYLPYGPFETLDKYFDWMKQSCLGSDPMFFAIIDKTKGYASGVASFLNIKQDVGTIEVGHINYSPLLQQTTAATEAMYLMMQYVFDLGYRRYEWKCNVLNAGSRTAAQRLGFSFEGIFRQAMIAKGRNRDTAWYSIIDTEWPSLHDAFLRWLEPSNFEKDGKPRTRLSELTAPIIEKRD